MTASAFRTLALAALVVLTAACANRHIVTESIGNSASAEEYLGYVRQTSGLSTMTPDPVLEKAAAQQARYMAETGRMVHTTGYGRDFVTRMGQNGVPGPAAENIAHGGMGLAKLFQMWADSPSHRKNMLDPRFKRYGLASATDGNGKRYWALVLGK